MGFKIKNGLVRIHEEAIFIITLVLILSALVLSLETKAQEFNQVNSVPLNYNPAFAGSLIEGRLCIDNRLEDVKRFTNEKEETNRFSISYDQYVSKLKGGIGIYVNGYKDFDNWNQQANWYIQDKISSISSNRKRNNLVLGIAYSPKFKIKNKISIAPAARLQFTKYDYITSHIDYAYSWDVDSTFLWQTHQLVFPMEKYHQISVEAALGIVVNTSNFYFGCSTQNYLNYGRIKYCYNNNIFDAYEIDTSYSYHTRFKTIPVFKFQTGYTLKFHQSKIAITPSFLASVNFNKNVKKEFINDIKAMLSIRYKRLEIGVGYLSDDAYWSYSKDGVTYNKWESEYVALIAYTFGKLRIGYSIETNKTENNTIYSDYEKGLGYKPNHELSLRYLIK
jgi:hypothetical protein